MLRDLRLALRRLLHQPGFSALAVIILALGLGAATAMFSLVDALYRRPLPFAEADRLVRIHRPVSADQVDGFHSAGAFLQYRGLTEVFEGVAAITLVDTAMEIEPGQTPDVTRGTRVTADYFEVFKVRPRLGRLFLPQEYQPGQHRVLLLSSQLWSSRFGGDPNVVGRQVRLWGTPYTVVGIMPPELHEPVRYWSSGLFWTPQSFAGVARDDYEDMWLRLFARLRPGVTMATAQAAVSAVAARIEAIHPTGSGARLRPPQETGAMDDAGKRVVWLSLALGLFVLLIACINLAGVQLARLGARRHDLAIRTALGASRGRLVREVFAESALLSVVGGALSVLVAETCTDLLAPRMIFGQTQATVGVSAPLDGRVLGFAFVLMSLTALAVGTVPAWLSARAAVAQTLRKGGRGATAASWSRLRQALVVAEMALALTLLAASGLLLRGLQRFAHVDPGWTVDRLLTGRLSLRGPRHQGEQGLAFIEQLQQRLAALPGVESAALSSDLPLWENGAGSEEVWLQGTPRPHRGQGPTAFTYWVTPEYLATMGISLREGRFFTAADRRSPDEVVVVSELMARQLWPGQSALGKRLGDVWSAPGAAPRWMTVVGVISDVRFAASLNLPGGRYQIYHPLRAAPGAMIALRTRGDPPALADVRRVLSELDSEVPLYAVLTGRALVDRSITNFSLMAWTLLGFATLGLVLSALGVYGLFAGYVVERTQEIGVRMALGAEAGQVLRLVLGKGLRVALLGGAMGVAGASLAGQLLRAAASGLPAHEPAVVAALALVLVAVALFACWLPARRAAALDPMVALRQE
jgi:predicted permease